MQKNEAGLMSDFFEEVPNNSLSIIKSSLLDGVVEFRLSRRVSHLSEYVIANKPSQSLLLLFFRQFSRGVILFHEAAYVMESS